MDKIKALELANEINGMVLNGYEVHDFINNGKSAAVFTAKKEGQFFALKIFDNELVERFGHEIQTKRIEQEIALKDHTIENLVIIYDGGNTIVNGKTYYFIVMELIDGDNLKDFIGKNDISQGFILNVLRKILNAANQLLSKKQIAHRDIKPENIMVRKDGEIILMDLGVLKLIGAKSFSDEEEKSFVGTLRYAPPEFLTRTEEDSVNGWRAINIYQIGATLHDLIMKYELFKDKIPYANLVIAIKDDTPIVSNSIYAFELLQIARDMLTKDWKKRLELVTQERLMKLLSLKEVEENSFDNGIEEILKMRLENQAKFDEIEKLQRTKKEMNEKKKEVGLKLRKIIDDRFEHIKNKGIFNSFKKSKHFAFDSDYYNNNNSSLIQNYLYEISGELKQGFPKNLYILVRISNDETNYAEIELWGIFPSVFAKQVIESPGNFFKTIFTEATRFQRNNGNYTLKTIDIFNGIINFDDSLNNHLNTQILKFIAKALKAVEKIVQEEIQWQKQLVESKGFFNSRITSGSNNIIIDNSLENL